jgi:hypothetical protein
MVTTTIEALIDELEKIALAGAVVSRALTGMVPGAAVGAMTAKPGNRMRGALIGGGLGAAGGMGLGHVMQQRALAGMGRSLRGVYKKHARDLVRGVQAGGPTAASSRAGLQHLRQRAAATAQHHGGHIRSMAFPVWRQAV